MNGPTAIQIRDRLDRALELLNSAEPTDLQKMRELWAILSDIQLWMMDMEEQLPEKVKAARNEY